MDKIRIDIFDILGYLVPGSALLMVFWVCVDDHVISVWNIYNSIHSIDQKTILLALLPAYIAGFMLHALGAALYDLYRHKKIRKYVPSQVQDNWAFIREYGGKHIAILERWYALRAFSQNLAAVSLIAGAVSIAKWWHFGYTEWLGVFFGSMALCLLALKRSEIFHRYLNDDIAVILKLNLGK
ncbi:MAG: hypothetical protein IPL27_28460 [Lewinellaceae bacterium]|nr:hypothetical protein [Lewinellaceae bacterium]